MTQTVRDADLKRQVTDELDWTPDVRSMHVGVSVKDGAVMLSGQVASFPERRLAELAALRVHGVNVVADELVVVTTFTHITDLDIARSAQASLAQHNAIPLHGVKVTVSEGHVRLSGTVQWRYQSDAADLAVRYLKGVTDLTNDIVISEAATAADIHHLIERGLAASHPQGRLNITVTLEEGTVTLEGSVKTWSERRIADGAAWSAPHVTGVLNRLLVQP